MKNQGKIALFAGAIIWGAVGVIFLVFDKAEAATTGTQVFTLPNTTTVTYDADTYITLESVATGDFVPAAGTAPVSGTAWSAADIATAANAQNASTYVATLPALNTSHEYLMKVWTGTAYTTADTLQAVFLYDPSSNSTFTDIVPLRGDHVKTGS